MSHGPRGSQRTGLRALLILLVVCVVGLLGSAGASADESPETDPWVLVHPPEIYGTPRVGELLGANQGEWSPFPSETTFTWLRDGTEVLESDYYWNYLVQPEDVGHMISARVTVTHADHGQRTATTAPVGPVDDDQPLGGGSPRPSGLPHPGQQIDANPTPWVGPDHQPVADVDVAYQWSRTRPNASSTREEIPGATSRLYTVSDDDLGWSIEVSALGTKPGYYSYPDVGYAGVIVPQVVNVARPTVTGSPTVGATLTGRPGSWAPEGPEAPRLTYQWLRNNSPITGATSLTYTLRREDAGSAVALRVTGKTDGYYFQNDAASSVASATVRYRSSIKISGRSTSRGKVTLSVSLTPALYNPGTVNILDGTRTVRRNVPLRNGKVTITLSRLKKGRHTFTVKYPTQRYAYSATNRVRITVR